MYEALGHPRKEEKYAMDNPTLYGPYAERHDRFPDLMQRCKDTRLCKDCLDMIRTPKGGGRPIPPSQLCDARVRIEPFTAPSMNSTSYPRGSSPSRSTAAL